MTPIILLDVDGVINAVTDEPPATWPTWNMESANGWPITWSPEMVAKLLRLHTTGLAQIQWLTTWWNDIPKLEFLGFPTDLEIPVTEEEFLNPSRDWWKLPVAQKVFAQGRPVVWIDDDIAFDPKAKAWVVSQEKNLLAISPPTRTGLTPAHLQIVEGFCCAFHL